MYPASANTVSKDCDVCKKEVRHIKEWEIIDKRTHVTCPHCSKQTTVPIYE
jgi:DNA-directed RNA polymerase subunit RPC12/RpoP